MHLVFGVVEVLTLLHVLASQPWNPNFYPTKTGAEFPYPFRQYGYNNYVTRSPYGGANHNFYAGFRSGGIFSGQGNNGWSGMMHPQNPYKLFPNFVQSNNPAIGNGENYVRKFGPTPYFPREGNSMVSVRYPQQEFLKSGTGLTFQANNGMSEATKNIIDVPFFKPPEYTLNAPQEQISGVNTFGRRNPQGYGWDWKQNSRSLHQFPNSAANLYEEFRNENERKASSSFPFAYSKDHATIVNGGGLSGFQNVPTFIPTQRKNNQNEFYKYGSQPIDAFIPAYENKLFSQGKLEGFGPLIKPFPYQRDIVPLFSEYPTTLQTIPKNKNIELQNLNLLADANSRNFLLEPITGNTNIFTRNNGVRWPSHQSNVRRDFDLTNQVSAAEDLSHGEIKNIDPLEKPYLHLKQYFSLSSDSPTFPDYSFKMREGQLYKAFIGANENDFPLKNQAVNEDFPSNEKFIKTFDKVHDTLAFTENRQKLDQNEDLSSQSFVVEESPLELGESDHAEKESTEVGNKLSVSSANEAVEKKTSVNDMRKTALKVLDDRIDGNTASFEPLENIVDKLVHGPVVIRFRKRLTTQESQSNNWDPFREDGLLKYEISSEEKPLSRSSEFSPTSQIPDDLKREEEFIPAYVPDINAPAHFMEQTRMLNAENGEYTSDHTRVSGEERYAVSDPKNEEVEKLEKENIF